jgi:transcriptional regulator with XRE-family HTH domain
VRVAGRDAPTALRWLIGVELSQYRNRAGKTVAAAATHLGSSAGRLSHLETGRNQQPPEDVGKLMRFYGADEADADRMTALAQTQEDINWFAPWADVVPDWLHTLVGLERLASKICTYSTSVFPAMLQTPGYSRAVTEGQPRVRPDHADRIVTLRMERQRPVLHGEPPTELTSFIEESVLDRPPTWNGEHGGWALQSAQLDHIVKMAERANIAVRVVPTSAGPHPAISAGPFTLLDFRLARSICYVEAIENAVYLSDWDQVRGYDRLVEQLQDVALSPADTLDLIRARIARPR